jgi:hypothetical protein
MRSLTYAELREYAYCLQNTWNIYSRNCIDNNQKPNRRVYEHLQKRYTNILRIIKLRELNFPKVGIYHIIREVAK